MSDVEQEYLDGLLEQVRAIGVENVVLQHGMTIGCCLRDIAVLKGNDFINGVVNEFSTQLQPVAPWYAKMNEFVGLVLDVEKDLREL
jgi:hypothetical protein